MLCVSSADILFRSAVWNQEKEQKFDRPIVFMVLTIARKFVDPAIPAVHGPCRRCLGACMSSIPLQGYCRRDNATRCSKGH